MVERAVRHDVRDRPSTFVGSFEPPEGGWQLLALEASSQPKHAYEKIRAGASLIEIYTGFIYKGITLPRDINRGLLELLRRDGFKTVMEAIGTNA